MSFSLTGTVVEFIIWVLITIGLPGLFALMAVESFGIPPLPSEVILTFAGFLVASGTFPLWGTFFAAIAGGLIGSYLGYAVGRWGREWLYRSSRHFAVNPRHLDDMDKWFARRGEATVGLARLAPVIRSYISYPAGAARMDPVRFGVFTVLGSIPFTALLLYLGFVLRAHWSTIESWFNYIDYVVAAGIVAFVVYYVLRLWKRPRNGGLANPPSSSESSPPGAAPPFSEAER